MRPRTLSITLAAGIALGLALLLIGTPEARTQGTNPSQYPPDHMDIVAERYFQKSFHVSRDGRGLKAMTVLTVPPGMTAVIENITAHSTAGISELSLEVQTIRAV